MIIQLLKDGKSLLTARSSHREGNSVSYLPITYEGDTDLLKNAWAEANVSLLICAFTAAAAHHGLNLAGDYEQARIRCSLPVAGNEEFERFFRDLEKKKEQDANALPHKNDAGRQ